MLPRRWRPLAAAPFLGLLLLPVIYFRQSADDYGEDGADDHFVRVVRSLQSVQQEREVEERRQKQALDLLVRSNLPWLTQNNTLPNYFLFSGGTQFTAEQYKTSAIVFLHQHRSGGSAIKRCISNMPALHPQTPFDSGRRKNWDRRDLFKKFTEKSRLQIGQYVFGVCNHYSHPCTYFSVFRDPLQSAISSYTYCKSAQADELCSALNANRVSLRDWILHHGSTVFHQLTFTSHWCNEERDEEDRIKPCWLQHKENMDKMNNTMRTQLTDYIVENLDQWFSVIGMFDELIPTLSMLKEVYKVPFDDCIKEQNAYLDRNSNIYHSLQPELLDNRANHVEHYEDEIEEELDDLRYDYFVTKSLEADYKIYEKARKIFNIQKQTLFNEIVHG